MGNPAGVPIAHYVFGGRRRPRACFVTEARMLGRRGLHGRDYSVPDDERRKRALKCLRRIRLRCVLAAADNMGDDFAHWLALGESFEPRRYGLLRSLRPTTVPHRCPRPFCLAGFSITCCYPSDGPAHRR